MPQTPWWCDAVLYHIYVRSFADSDGDGVGDLRGIASRLDYLERLGVNALWLSPVCPSPDADWGYDVADYMSVQPAFGTLQDFDDLVAGAAARSIRILCDLVPNHTSDRHPWFRDEAKLDWYVWSEGRAPGEPPNNWLSSFGGPAWTFDEGRGQWYLHNFLPQQPDLNWWNSDVRDEFDRILNFWFERGVAGFRIDVCHMVVKDAELRDNPPATEEDHASDVRRGQVQAYNANRPEVHDVLRRWRKVAQTYDPERLLLGETYVFDPDRLASYHGQGDELHLAFNFPFVFSRFDAESLRSVVEATETSLLPDAWPVWTASNHDATRFPTRWCAGDDRKIRCALLMLMTLRGTPVLYYGDEIGMCNVDVPAEHKKDPVGRDPGRTPMHWSPGPGAGFTTGVPWLPLGDPASGNAEDQEDDPASTLNLCRDLIRLRRSNDALRLGPYEALDAPAGIWAWRRGPSTVVVLNLKEESVSFPLEGRVLIGTDRARDGMPSGEMTLSGWEGVVVETAQP